MTLLRLGIVLVVLFIFIRDSSGRLITDRRKYDICIEYISMIFALSIYIFFHIQFFIIYIFYHIQGSYYVKVLCSSLN